MKKPVKVIAVFVFVLLAAGVAVPFFVNVDGYRPRLESFLTQEMGVPVKIEHPLRWHVHLKGVSLDLFGVSFGSAIRADNLSLRMPWQGLVSALRGRAGDTLDARARDAVVHEIPLRDLTARIAVSGTGEVVADPVVFQIGSGGRGQAVFRYNEERFFIEGSVTDVDYALFLPGGEGGAVRGRFDLSGAGVADLSGDIAFLGGEGRLSGRAITFWADDLLTRTLTGAAGENKTTITCLFLQGRLESGVFSPQQALLETDHVKVKAAGTVDLARERLDLVLIPSPKDPAFFSLATPVRVSGNWQEPRILPDGTAVLRKAGVGLLGSLLAPPAVLLPFVKTGDASGSPCLEAGP